MARKRTKHAGRTEVYRKPAIDFSLTGLIYCSLMMFMGLAAVNSQANLLFGVFGLMIGVLLVSASISRMVLRKLEIHRVMPEFAVVGQPLTLTYEFRNRKRFWPSLSVCLGELDGCDAFTRQPFGYMLHAAPGTRAVVPTELIPMRRGLYTLGNYQLSTGFPFGFVKRAIVRQRKDKVLVYPALAQVDPRLLAKCVSAEKTGAMMRPRRGGQDEFYGVKEFRNGENRRLIYWRRSARTGVLVAKEMTQVSPPRLLVLVDTYAPPADAAGCVAVERTIAMAASLASHALETGLSVGLLVWSDGWLTLPSNRGKRHRRDILTALAQLPVNTRVPLQQLLDNGRELLRAGTTPVVFTPRAVQLGLSDESRGDMLVISAAAPQSEKWFRFGPHVDFEQCTPAEQKTN